MAEDGRQRRLESQQIGVQRVGQVMQHQATRRYDEERGGRRRIEAGAGLARRHRQWDQHSREMRVRPELGRELLAGFVPP